MDNNYNNDQSSGYGDDPAQGQGNGGYTAQNDTQDNTYGQNYSGGYDAQNNYNQPNNGYGAQNNPYGQPTGSNYGPQNNPYGQQGAPYGPQNNPYGQPNNPQYGPQNFYQNGNPYGAPYLQDPYQQQPPLEGSIGLSVASMVLGICAILCSCCFYPVAFLLALVGLILGAVAIKKGPAGKGMAITGLILSIISVAIAVLILIFAASLGISSGISDIF